jgi:putative sterol carrier protein
MDAAKFIKGLPERVDPEVIDGMQVNFHFDISGDTGGQFTVDLKDNRVVVLDSLEGEPDCRVKTSDENLGKLLSGDLNPMMAVMTGKIKVSNPGILLKYSKILGIL